ncbi:hypothetical protein LTR10_020892 [Elasticomyces elasticus]|nr:hypothetical protein LTR10_020892 [Elasticomyces elasticus]
MLMPGLATQAANLALYRRTPNWIAGSPGYCDKIPEATHWLMNNMPFYSNWFGNTCFIRGRQIPPLQVHDREWQTQGGFVNQQSDAMRKGLTEYVRAKVKGNTELAKKLTPSYAPLVRRLVVDNGFYDALPKDNVELVTEPIATFTEDGITTKDSQHRQFDLVVLACGFKPKEYLWPIKFTAA